MSTFKAEVQNKRADGTYNVRIRVTHNRQQRRISTNIYVTQADLTKGLKIKNQSILSKTDSMITACRSLCNDIGYSLQSMDIDQLVGLLKRRLSGEDDNILKEAHTQLEIDINTIKKEIIESSEFVAMQIIKELYPDLDNISFRKACKFAGTNGRRWLENHISNGNICPIIHGATKNLKHTFSRIEIHALKKAEELKSKNILNMSQIKNKKIK